MINGQIARICAGENLQTREIEQVFDSFMRGDCSNEQIAAVLTALKQKGETVDELAGAAAAMRKHMTPIRHHREEVIDTCGPGGHRSGTFNISTAAALVTAAAGVPVAKHGNRSITSKTGSADALAALGVEVAPPPAIVEKCLDELGVCFCFAPSLHPAMKNVSTVRKELGFPTIFNLLGPLCNPAGAAYQLMGVGRAELRPLLSAALAKLGVRRALVAFGEDGIGEVSLAGRTQISEVRGAELGEKTWQPGDFGLEAADRQSLLANNPAESAEIIRGILDGRRGPPRDIVVLNAAAALFTAEKYNSEKEAAQAAAAAIDSGAAKELLARLVAMTNSGK